MTDPCAVKIRAEDGRSVECVGVYAIMSVPVCIFMCGVCCVLCVFGDRSVRSQNRAKTLCTLASHPPSRSACTFIYTFLHAVHTHLLSYMQT